MKSLTYADLRALTYADADAEAYDANAEVAAMEAADPTPPGKRRIRETAWGNLKGYVSGRYWTTFGSTNTFGVRETAEAWLKAGEK